MKAKELMCDDLVSHRGNTYKVFGIMRNADGVDLAPIHLRNAEGLMLGPITCFATEVEPIPLTEEILTKNDFEVVKEYREFQDDPSWHFEHKSRRIIYFEDYSLVIIKGSKIPTTIKYVHELQHALRLCRLDDIADNFHV